MVKGRHILLFTLEWNFIEAGIAFLQFLFVHPSLSGGHYQGPLGWVSKNAAAILTRSGQQGIIAQSTYPQ